MKLDWNRMYESTTKKVIFTGLIIMNLYPILELTRLIVKNVWINGVWEAYTEWNKYPKEVYAGELIFMYLRIVSFTLWQEATDM